MSDEQRDPNHVPGLFGGPLTIERINQFVREFKTVNAEPIVPVPIIVPAWLYDRAAAQGCDMTDYVRQERTPTE